VASAKRRNSIKVAQSGGSVMKRGNNRHQQEKKAAKASGENEASK